MADEKTKIDSEREDKRPGREKEKETYQRPSMTKHRKLMDITSQKGSFSETMTKDR